MTNPSPALRAQTTKLLASTAQPALDPPNPKEPQPSRRLPVRPESGFPEPRHERKRGRGSLVELQLGPRPPPSDLPIWVRPREACRLIGCGLTFLYQLINEEKVESRLVGRARLIRRLDLERLGQG